MSTKTPSRKFSRQQLLVAIAAAVVAFLTYTSIFAYRKPFTVATFEGVSFWGVKYQVLLIISQVVGYMISKFYGIKFISELGRLGRWKSSAVLIGASWLAMLIFAVLPAPWGMLCLFINGFCLGFMWGIIFSYVEGRRATDFIGTSLAVSFIFAGGFTRSVAVYLRDHFHIAEQWLAFATGLVFALPLIVFMYLLERIPAPDADDIAERTERLPMNKEDRIRFMRTFGLGVLAVVLTYLFLTIMRDIRDNFMANIWNELGYGQNAAIFTRTETITSIIVLIIMSLVVLIRKNILALNIVHILIFTGFALAGLSSLFFFSGRLDGAMWMQLTGLGLYMGYIPFNCIFFDRLIATFKVHGNVGFLIYTVDAWGYLGSILVMLWKEFSDVEVSWLAFFPVCVMIFTTIGLVGTLFSGFYFSKKYKKLGL